MLQFEPSETQMKFLQATERIVFFGGGAKRNWFLLNQPH